MNIFKSFVVKMLTWEARLVLKKYKPFIVAVTGSVGKTGTKDAIYHVLKNTTTVRKSQKSFNSELGLPLTILGLENAWKNPFVWGVNILKGFAQIIFPCSYPKLLVLEIGADHPGDIKRVTQWMKPDIAVLTRLPERPVHVEYFSSPKEVQKEKAELVRALGEHGVFVANGDDAIVVGLNSATRARMLTYGFGDTTQVHGSYPKINYEEVSGRKVPIGMTFFVEWQGNSIPVRLNGVLGMHPCMAALAALAVGTARGVSLVQMAESLAMLATPPGRMRIIAGKNESIIIDDSYNSSPVAVEAALETLKEMEGSRKIAILGDMLELGEYSDEEHLHIGEHAGKFVDELIVVGKRATGIALGAVKAGMSELHITQFENSLEAGEWLAQNLQKGDIILAKGSQGSGENMIRMERVVKALMASPDEAKKLLVRQEKEWLAQYE